MTTRVKRRRKLTIDDIIELERLRIEGNHSAHDNDTILEHNGIELTPQNIYSRIVKSNKTTRKRFMKRHTLKIQDWLNCITRAQLE